MITFLVCLALLVTAYFTYGRYLERLVGIDPAAGRLAAAFTTAWITCPCRGGAFS